MGGIRTSKRCAPFSKLLTNLVHLQLGPPVGGRPCKDASLAGSRPACTANPPAAGQRSQNCIPTGDVGCPKGEPRALPARSSPTVLNTWPTRLQLPCGRELLPLGLALGVVAGATATGAGAAGATSAVPPEAGVTTSVAVTEPLTGFFCFVDDVGIGRHGDPAPRYRLRSG